EVDQRFRVLQVLYEVDPARVGFHVGIANVVVDRGAVEFTTRLVKRRNAGVATAREIEHGQVEWQPNQVVAQRFRYELVDLIADSARDPTYNGADCLFRG